MEQEREDDPYEAIQFGDFGTYIRHKKQKLQLQQEEIAALAAPDTAQIFEGIVVYVNGYTDPPIHELKNMIVQRGGEFRQYLSKNSTTHIIASNLTQAKMREFRNYKVAKPEWITESVKANKLLQWHKFSTLRVPTSLSKLGEAFLTQSSMAPSPPSHHTNTGSGSADPEHKGPDPAPLEVLDDIHVDLPDHHDQDFLMLGKRVRACVDRDAGVALGAVDNKVESAEPFWDDEDLFLDDLELDHFEFQPTPPTNVFEATVALPVSYDSESDQGLRPKACLRSEHAEVGTAVTVDINSTNGREAVLDESHPTLIELSVPWNRLNSSVQPGFVEKFYQSSRLHYLSTWKIRLKDITTEIQKDRVPALSKDKNKIIMHVDFDCFFASVATRSKPELRDLPIAVAHGSGGSTSNSEIASCNYLARGYGVKNGMQLLRARALCPDLLVVPYEFQEYEDISIEFYKILLTYADELQAVSVDEALLDVTSKCLPLWDQRKSNTADHRGDVSSSRMAPGMLADRVREQIFLATGCHASVGVAPNVLLAKLATKRAKPHGQYIWPGAPGSEETLRELRGPKPLPMDTDIDTSLTPSGSEDGSQPIKRDFPVVNQSSNLKEFSVNDLPGVGHKTKQELKERFSVQTLYELQQVSREELQRICGMKTGEMLYNSCRGIDETTLASDRDKARQSVSAEISWGVRFENQDQVDVFLWDLAREVSKRLKEIDRKGKSVVMKVMKRKEYVVGHWKHLGHGPVDQFARTGQLPMYTDDPDIIAREARNLLQHFKFSVLDLRGLGIQVLKLNNEVINAVSKTAFASLDSMNQTTLSAAMFQRRVPTAIVGGSVDPGKILLYEHLTPFPKSMELSEPKNEVSQGDLTLEIDSETFKELPTDIQEELSRHHRFVFVNQNGSETTNTASSEEMQLNDHPGLDLCAPLHHRSKDKDLAPPAVDHTLLPWSQVDPAELVALSTPAMRDTLKEYAGMNRYSHARSSTLHIDDPQHLETGILPSPSKLDRSVLQSLPPEIRAEIEQEYTHIMENNELIRKLARPSSSHTADSSSVSLLHQPVITDNQGGSRGRGKSMGRGSTRGRPRGRGRGRGRELGNLNNGVEYIKVARDDVGEALREARERDRQHKSLQESASDRETSSSATYVPPLDSEFLAALPPDIRAELEAAHKVEIMKSRQKHALTKDQSTAVFGAEYSKECGTRIDRSVLLERPTLMGLHHLDEIRNMLSEWVQSTLLREEGSATNVHGVHDASSPAYPGMIIYDEGPNPEDVRSFSEYIARVIFMERDLDKVRLLLRYLERKTEDNKRKATPAHLSPRHLQVLISWSEALKSISSVAEHLVAVLYGGTFTTD